LTLYDTIQLPKPEEDPTDTLELTGFVHLIKLYKPFDEKFFGLWNRSIHGAVPSWLVQLQQQLSEALPNYLEGTETQVVDLKMSQQWLKIMIWQLAISHGFISSMASDNTLSFKFPIEISRDLVEMSADFSQRAMEVHGSGVVSLTQVLISSSVIYNPVKIGGKALRCCLHTNRCHCLCSTVADFLRHGTARLSQPLRGSYILLARWTVSLPPSVAEQNCGSAPFLPTTTPSKIGYLW
jgi:hypothetical protein